MTIDYQQDHSPHHQLHCPHYQQRSHRSLRVWISHTRDLRHRGHIRRKVKSPLCTVQFGEESLESPPFLPKEDAKNQNKCNNGVTTKNHQEFNSLFVFPYPVNDTTPSRLTITVSDQQRQLKVGSVNLSIRLRQQDQKDKNFENSKQKKRHQFPKTGIFFTDEVPLEGAKKKISGHVSVQIELTDDFTKHPHLWARSKPLDKPPRCRSRPCQCSHHLLTPAEASIVEQDCVVGHKKEKALSLQTPPYNPFSDHEDYDDQNENHCVDKPSGIHHDGSAHNHAANTTQQKFYQDCSPIMPTTSHAPQQWVVPNTLPSQHNYPTRDHQCPNEHHYYECHSPNCHQHLHSPHCIHHHFHASHHSCHDDFLNRHSPTTSGNKNGGRLFQHHCDDRYFHYRSFPCETELDQMSHQHQAHPHLHTPSRCQCDKMHRCFQSVETQTYSKPDRSLELVTAPEGLDDSNADREDTALRDKKSVQQVDKSISAQFIAACTTSASGFFADEESERCLMDQKSLEETEGEGIHNQKIVHRQSVDSRSKNNTRNSNTTTDKLVSCTSDSLCISSISQYENEELPHHISPCYDQSHLLRTLCITVHRCQNYSHQFIDIINNQTNSRHGHHLIFMARVESVEAQSDPAVFINDFAVWETTILFPHNNVSSSVRFLVAERHLDRNITILGTGRFDLSRLHQSRHSIDSYDEDEPNTNRDKSPVQRRRLSAGSFHSHDSDWAEATPQHSTHTSGDAASADGNNHDIPRPTSDPLQSSSFFEIVPLESISGQFVGDLVISIQMLTDRLVQSNQCAILTSLEGFQH